MRLSASTLHRVATGIATPSYDRRAVRTGIVHLGIGAFHRAHQAVTFDNALAAGDMRWGVLGVSLRSAAVRDQLAPQDGLYTLVERSNAESRMRIIGSVSDVLVAPEEPQRIVAALASADVHMVTLTVTEKGYKLDPANGQLREDDPDVAADLANISAPRTAPGLIVAGLAARRAAGLPPFTAISCDNLSRNGLRLKTAVLRLARHHDGALADWIEECGAFPQTMVDRIVPATSAEDLGQVANWLGLEDRATVRTEPFSQWIVEDDFCAERPDFAALGVEIVADVGSWEEAKLRLLNGAHSGIAYLGALASIATVDAFVAAPHARRFVEMLWDEVATTFDPPQGLDIRSYRRALMARFDNASLAHATRQIAADGSQKLPQRLIAPLIARRSAGRSIDAIALAIAGWMRWQAALDDAGRRFQVDDPLAGEMARLLGMAASPRDRVGALLSMPSVFPASLREDGVAVRSLVAGLETLERHGALAALAMLQSDCGPSTPDYLA
jgi:fructuronate reductase